MRRRSDAPMLPMSPLPRSAEDLKAFKGFFFKFLRQVDMANDAHRKAALDPAALTLEDAARVLGLERQMLDADLEAGAPMNADGTINLVHYAAWLNHMGREDSDGQA